MDVRRLAVLTSGGDAPGMNAAIRAVTRAALARGWEVLGVLDGYRGLLEDDFVPLTDEAVGGIMARGGTILGSAREPRMQTEEGIAQAAGALERRGVQALVVIGGNGSQSGALALWRAGVDVVGVASTIDNDLAGTDTSIGVDTALNTAVAAVDALKDTASSHRRAFVVETMGRASGYLATRVALATGAERAVVPEKPDEDERDIVADAAQALARKRHYLCIVAEGARVTAAQIHAALLFAGIDAKLTVLGHVQRGGRPTAFDRALATRLGVAAVEAVELHQHGSVIGWRHGGPVRIPLAVAIRRECKVTAGDAELVELLG